MTKGVRITDTGQIFYTDYLQRKYEPEEFSYEVARLLNIIKYRADKDGIAKLPKRMPSEMMLAYDILKENKLIEEIEGDLIEEMEGTVERIWKRKDAEDLFKQGYGPPPPLFGDFEDF